MLKSKKRLIILFIIIGVFAVLLICGSTLFSLKKVTVEFTKVQAENSTLATYSKESIINSGNFCYGKNILFADYAASIDNIEKAFPYAKVEKVTRNFPNRIVVYITERQPLVKIQSGTNYVVLDAQFKVLKITATLSAEEQDLPTWQGLTFDTNKTAGDFILDNNYRSMLSDINRAITDDDVNLQISILSGIILTKDSGSEVDILSLVLNDGVTVKVNGTNNLAEKVLGAMNIYQVTIANNSTTYPNKTTVIVNVPQNYTLAGNVGITVSK